MIQLKMTVPRLASISLALLMWVSSASDLLAQSNQTIQQLFVDGIALQSKGNYAQALKVWNEVIQKAPGEPAAYVNRGITRYGMNDLTGALKDFSEAIIKKRDYADAYFNRAVILSDLGDYQAAVADYQQYLTLNPNAPDSELARNKLNTLRQRERVATQPLLPERPSSPSSGAVSLGKISGYDATTDDTLLGLKVSVEKKLLQTSAAIYKKAQNFVVQMKRGTTIDQALKRSGLDRQSMIRLTWRGAAWRTYRVLIR